MRLQRCEGRLGRREVRFLRFATECCDMEQEGYALEENPEVQQSRILLDICMHSQKLTVQVFVNIPQCCTP